MDFDFADILLEVLERKASDLHITVGTPPMVRVRGRLTPMEGYSEALAERHARDHLLDPLQRSAPAS